jgi:hypothetical protein
VTFCKLTSRIAAAGCNKNAGGKQPSHPAVSVSAFRFDSECDKIWSPQEALALCIAVVVDV